MALKDGVAGAQIVKYFEETHGMTPVSAETLPTMPGLRNVYSYRLTFEDGKVANYAITYSGALGVEVVHAEPIS